jgi:hypothetical protein
MSNLYRKEIHQVVDGLRHLGENARRDFSQIVETMRTNPMLGLLFFALGATIATGYVLERSNESLNVSKGIKGDIALWLPEISRDDQLRAKLELFHGDDGYDYVNQIGLPFSYRLGYGHQFIAVANFDENTDCSDYGLTTCEGVMGYAHGVLPGSQVDGFYRIPDPFHPGVWLYYPFSPLPGAPTTSGRVEG